MSLRASDTETDLMSNYDKSADIFCWLEDVWAENRLKFCPILEKVAENAEVSASELNLKVQNFHIKPRLKP